MPSVIKDNQIQDVPDNEVEYEMLSPARLVGANANVVPMSSNAQSPRLFYAARFVEQAMPLSTRETPLVQSLDPESEEGKSFEQEFGRKMGAMSFDKDTAGTVQEVTDDLIKVKGDDGKTYDIPLYNNFQFNRKTYIQSNPVVKAGDRVKKGQLLAGTNFTDNEGTMAMGVNARVALVPYKGHSMDDAIVISESFANRLRSMHNYQHELQKDDQTKFGKVHYASLFPAKFTREQLDKLDDDGMAKPGTVLQKGDPIMLATKPKPIYSNAEHLGRLGKIFRSIRADAAETWEHDYPGVVTDTVNGKKGFKVFVKAEAPAQIGDKIVIRNGQKCFHPSTEILTVKGWKPVGKVTQRDKVGALFPSASDSHAYEVRYENVIDTTSYDYKGWLYGVQNDKVDFLVTPNHRLWASYSPEGEYRASEMFSVRMKEIYVLAGKDGEDKVTTASAVKITKDDHVSSWYDGKVYCCQVPGLGVVLARRNGKACWIGNSIISKILPDNQILRGTDGTPFEILLNPLALPSRVNTATLYEMMVGKVAKKQGKPIAMPAYVKPGESRLEIVKKMLKDADLTDTEEVFDPMLNRKLENPVSTGVVYVNKLHHVVDAKKSARGNAGYDSTRQPLKGGSEAAQAKRLGGLETTALMAKGAYDILRDSATIRGSANDDYWKAVRQGYKPAEPGSPFAWDKFRYLLNGAGYNIKDLGKGKLRLAPMTDKDLDEKDPMEVQNGKLIRPDTLEPEEGGLFDSRMVALNKWGKITLPHALPNPAMENQIATLLRVKVKDLRRVLAGEVDLEDVQKKA